MNQALQLTTGQDIKLSGRHGTIKHIDNDVIFIKFGDKSYSHFATYEIHEAANEGMFHIVEKPIDIRCVVNVSEKDQRECDRRSAYCEAFLAFKEVNPTKGLKQELIDEVYVDIENEHPQKPSIKTLYGWYKLWLSDGQDMGLQVVHISDQDQRMDDEVNILMRKMVKKHYLKRSKPTMSAAYGYFTRAFIAKKRQFPGIDVPSKSTFERFIKRLSKYEVNCARYGKKHADKENRAATDAYAVTTPLELVQCDGAEFNIGLLNEDGTYAGKVGIFAVMDTATRSCLGYTVQVSTKPKESAAVVIHSLGHSMRIKKDPMKYPMGGIGMTYVFDNGPGYRAEMTRKFMHAVGSDVTYCRSRRADEKPHCERMFGTWRTKFFKGLPGYLGKRKKEIIPEQTIKQAATLTVAEFMELFEAYIQDEYHHTPNRGINNWTPFEMWQEHTRIDEVMTLTDFDDRLKLRGNAKRLTCTSTHGVTHRGQRFQSDELKAAVNNNVKNFGDKSIPMNVLIDDFDASAISVVLSDQCIIEVPNVAKTPRDVSFTELDSHMRKVNQDDLPEPLTVQKAKNRVQRKRANGTLVEQDTLIKEDDTNNPTQTMEQDFEQHTTITDEQRNTTTGFGDDD
ncbi:MAG: hypothetical protein ACI88H_000706 [Cocleimonas sp.]|jgi:hypothetical protein